MDRLPPKREELHKAAADVIAILKTIPEFQDSKIAVIGGLAVWNYLQSGRTTKDVDFIVNIDSTPHGVKSKLLALENSPFVQLAQVFMYQAPNGRKIQIGITHESSAPYFPEAAMKIKNVPNGKVPYISPTDLIVFKMFCCGRRLLMDKKRVDAMDAMDLVLYQNQVSKIELSPETRKIIEPCIDNVVKYGEKSKDWWRTQLGFS
ncbi:hypothetical protein E4U42_003490 [Claviceps africana]|uniref:Uncharacterized protein n=1 Tax=Claviceps africana TaxID=83212 RepID=A0A8K0J6I3_9HYPO|nr:hypothetical protein E4U42_003490 [Claviceps africana]